MYEIGETWKMLLRHWTELDSLFVVYLLEILRMHSNLSILIVSELELEEDIVAGGGGGGSHS